LLAQLLALAAAAAPAPSPAELAGVWEGNVGTLPIRACFVRRDAEKFGAYYYLSRLRLIPLEADEAGTGFHEGVSDEPSPPRWTIDRVDGAELTGRWTARGRALPVRLHRLARMTGDDSPCASMVFHRPRLEGVRTVPSRATLDGTAYTKLTLDLRGRFESSFETFALDGGGAAAQRINAALGAGLAGDPPAWFECIGDSLGFAPLEGSFEESLAPTMFTRRWLVVAHHWDGDCGGAHPDSTNSYRIFDLADGREIDIFDWLNARAVHRERPEGSGEELKSLVPAFRDVVLARWRPDTPECDEPVRSEEFWTIGLRRDAFVFSPDLAHVVQACAEDFVVPFDRLRAYLSAEGAANVAALAAEQARR
jgi:hypothetical protein